MWRVWASEAGASGCVLDCVPDLLNYVCDVRLMYTAAARGASVPWAETGYCTVFPSPRANISFQFSFFCSLLLFFLLCYFVSLQVQQFKVWIKYIDTWAWIFIARGGETHRLTSTNSSQITDNNFVSATLSLWQVTIRWQIKIKRQRMEMRLSHGTKGTM